MKKFINRLLIFSILFGFCTLLLELLVLNIPNNYSTKYDYLEKDAANVEILILGNSTTFYGLNPGYFTRPTYNLAQVSQTLDIDCLLLKKYLAKMPSVKTIIIPITYTSFFEVLGYSSESWRTFNYNRYMCITPLFENKSLISSLSTTFSNDVTRFGDYYFKRKSQLSCSSLGFGTDFNSSNTLDYIWKHAIKTAKYHLISNDENVLACENSLIEILNITERHNIDVIVITPPTHPFYQENINKEQLNKTTMMCNRILASYPNVQYIDYSNDIDFKDSDFYDSNHLNNDGAKKLSSKLNVLLIN